MRKEKKKVKQLAKKELIKSKFLKKSWIVILIILVITVLIFFSINKTKGCSKGFSMSDGVCKKEIDIKEPTIEYYCEEGASLDDYNNTCIKNVKFESPKEVTCDLGYKLEGDKCTIEEVVPYRKYYCENGTLDGNICILTTTTYPATENKGCSEWMYSVYYEYGTGQSYCKYSGSADNFTKCPNGYTFHYASQSCYPKMPVIYKYYCDGASSNSKTCTRTKTVSASYIEGCPKGYEHKDDMCYGKAYVDPLLIPYCKAGYKMDCNNGAINKDLYCTCSGIEVENASYRLKCDEGYIMDDNSCILYEIEKR